MSIQWYIGQRVVCLSDFPMVVGKCTVKNPISDGSIYTVKSTVKDKRINQIGLVLRHHWQTIENSNDLVFFSEDGFMPFDLWVKNSRAVDELMKEIL